MYTNSKLRSKTQSGGFPGALVKPSVTPRAGTSTLQTHRPKPPAGRRLYGNTQPRPLSESPPNRGPLKAKVLEAPSRFIYCGSYTGRTVVHSQKLNDRRHVPLLSVFTPFHKDLDAPGKNTRDEFTTGQPPMSACSEKRER